MGKETKSKNDSIAEISGYGYCTRCETYHKKTSDMYLKHNQFIKENNAKLDDFF